MNQKNNNSTCTQGYKLLPIYRRGRSNALSLPSRSTEIDGHMLEVTQEILEKVDPLLDTDDSEAAGKLLVDADPTSLRALLIHILRERGTTVADAVGTACLREQKTRAQIQEAA